MSERNKQVQLWSHPDFVARLKVIKLQRELKKIPTNNLGELTKMIIENPKFKEIEEEILNGNMKINLKIKMDKKRL